MRQPADASRRQGMGLRHGQARRGGCATRGSRASRLPLDLPAHPHGQRRARLPPAPRGLSLAAPRRGPRAPARRGHASDAARLRGSGGPSHRARARRPAALSVRPRTSPRTKPLPSSSSWAWWPSSWARPPASYPCRGSKLEAAGLDPVQVSPFSGRWMSFLDPARARDDFGLRHDPLRHYLDKIVSDFLNHPRATPPPGYASRAAELALVEGLG